MPLKTLVKVGNITNLSDARYCAGMGVDLLGFPVIEGLPNFLAPNKFQEIRGWVTGPQVVAEVFGIRNKHELDAILENYKPDYLEMGLVELALFSTLPVPYILVLDKSQSIDGLAIQPAYVLCSEFIDVSGSVPFILEVQSASDLEQALRNPRVMGIAMNGSSEIRPGLKDYNMLAEILEQLEID